MLWVIAQDKKVLVNVKEVTVKGKFIEGVVNRSFFVYWSKVLGEYETTERAKEIVEEIYTKIEQGNNSIITFSMPAN